MSNVEPGRKRKNEGALLADGKDHDVLMIVFEGDSKSL